MHEFSLMENILSAVLSKAEEQGLKRVQRIGIQVGELSGAMPDALQFAFDVLQKQSPLLQSAQLDIQIIPAKVRCSLCQQEYRPDQRIALCPACHLPSGKLVQGEELTIDYLDGEREE